jgi:biotin carboxyl carrier protein
MGPSIEEIREILQIFLDSELEDLRLEIGDVRLAVSKGGAAGLAVPAPSSAAAAVPEGWVAVTAPSVGVFYRRPAPDQPPFVEEGGEVAESDPVGLIEVMKMFTSIAAPCPGRIARIAIEDATMVEYGQPLMYIEPA